MHLFLVLDRAVLDTQLSPALAASFRGRSFAPLGALIQSLTPRFETVTESFHLTRAEQPLVLQCASTGFDRRLWRHFAGELLLYCTAESPSFPVAPDLLAHFLPMSLVERLHRGSRELSFAGVPYRTDRAGLHAEADVAELLAQLNQVDPDSWLTSSLRGIPAEDCDEELNFARQCLRDLRTMVAAAYTAGQVIVCEEF